MRGNSPELIWFPQDLRKVRPSFGGFLLQVSHSKKSFQQLWCIAKIFGVYTEIVYHMFHYATKVKSVLTECNVP